MQIKILDSILPMRDISKFILIVPFVLLFLGCKKLLESEPPSDFVSGENVYTTDAAAIAVLNGLYINMSQSGYPFQGTNGISFLSGLDADELTLYSGVTNTIYIGHYKNALSQTLTGQQVGAEHWGALYNFIFKCNAAIEGLNKSESLTPMVKQQLIGEAQFLRAFMYFYLVNFFGDVPLPLTTDPEINPSLTRLPREQVYKQIISDLQAAENSLSPEFINESLLGSSLERVRPTKWAAAALLARVYLYTEDWVKAEDEASEIINNKTLFDLVKLNDVFFKNSKEAIFQLQGTAINFNTVDAQIWIIPETGPSSFLNPVFLSDTLINSFEQDDLRAKPGNWINTTIYKLNTTINDTVTFSYKYKLNLSDPDITGAADMKEYFMVLRLGEQYLIRAEARAQLDKLNEAKDDLNAIRARAFSPAKPVTVTNKTDLLTAILHERQVELFLELGHRWFDLKRTGKIDDVMRGLKPLKANGAVWESYQQWYPLPLESDLLRSFHLQQNEGY